MIRYVFLVLISLVSLSATAQIAFQHLTLDEAKAKAKAENKPIFVDVHAVWCGPCKQMAANAFTDPALGKYYNDHFINVKIDGEKEAEGGPKTMREYGITAYPTLLYINPDGSLNQKVVGGQDIRQLWKHAKTIIDPTGKTLAEARKKYHSSKRTNADMRTYLSVLMTEASDSLEAYAKLYYNTNSKLDLTQETDLFVFYKYEENYQSPTSAYFLEHISEFKASQASEKVLFWVRAVFQEALAAKDYTRIENTVKALHPSWSKVEAGLPALDDYLVLVKQQYDQNVPK